MPISPAALSGKTWLAAGLGQLGRQRGDQLVVERIDLVERHHHRLVGQPRAIGVELVADDAVAGRDILVIGIDQVQQHLAALDMAEEAVADAGALGRALDQAGNVGDDELAARGGGPRRAAGASVVKA